MQQREKILAGVLGGVVLIALMGPFVERTFLVPLREAEDALDTARQSYALVEEQQLQLIRSQARLKRWEEVSLPADPDVAMRVYLKWLTDCVEISGWQGVKISPGRRSARSKYYSTIPVTLEANVTWEQLGRFLSLYEQAEILQRVSQLDLESRGTDPGPIHVTLTAEALSLKTGPKQNTLTASTSLPAELDVGGTQLSIGPQRDFPTQTPFLVRIGSELASVVEVTESGWRLQRGVAGTAARTHSAGTEVERFPIDVAGSEIMQPLAELKQQEFFFKPQPVRTYSPKLVLGTPAPAYFQRPWTHSVSVEGWNPNWDEPAYVLTGDVPTGLEIDPATGELFWTPTPSEEPVAATVNIAVMSIWDERPKLTGELTLRAIAPNLPPILDIPAAVNAYLGRPGRFDFAASNPEGESDRLTYTLAGTLPEGATFDTRSGLLSWNVPITGVPGESILELTVTDDGTPPASVTRTVKLTVQDDVALYTYLTGIVDVSGKSQAWFRDRTTNRRQVLSPGDSFVYGDVQGTVRELGYDYVVFAQDRQRYRVKTGQNLRQLEQLAPEPPPLGASIPPVPLPEQLPIEEPTASGTPPSNAGEPPSPAPPLD
ncbi:MAG: putative Ig domain-containing protein [Planctomycetaceae bacterium]|nr:putative Ig domain-containing protein [Planctomycetaceae bacterium]